MLRQTFEVDSYDFTHGGEYYDVDRYTITRSTPLATKEYNVIVEHTRKEISGDAIRYGSWIDLDAEELQELVEVIKAEHELARPIDGYTFA